MMTLTDSGNLPTGDINLSLAHSPESAARDFAPYAIRDEHSRGRKHPEPPHAYRGAFQRDRDRIVHCEAFRRLSDKTQVFTGEMGDYHRTRLTHTMEVALIARTLARALRLNEDFVEAAAYMHDLGHPPFGHSGEAALNECLAEHGGFCHNSHGLAIVEQLERRYPFFPGLNLSVELLESQAARIKGKRREQFVDAQSAKKAPLLEAQVVDAADSTAYNAHDADDALELELIDWGDLMQIRLWAETAKAVQAKFADLPRRDLAKAVVHDLINRLVGDVLANSRAALADARPASSTAACAMPAACAMSVVIRPSRELRQLKAELEKFLHERVYRHPKVMAVRDIAQNQLRTLFDRYCTKPELLPPPHLDRAESVGVPRAVGDFLACMTDRHAIRTFEEAEDK